MRVKDICILQNGRAFKPDDWSPNGIPIVRIQNLNDENAPFNYFQGEYDSVHEVNDGELLFSWSGTPGTSFGAFRWNRGKGVLNQHIFKVIPKIDVDKEYLRYAFNGNLNAIISKAHGGVGLQHITKKELDEIEIPIVSLADQHKIVSILYSVEKIFANRQFELAKLDELIKARFVEMFGDPITNPYNLPIVTLGELSELITKGASPSWQGFSYTEDSSQTLFVTSENVREGYLDLSSPKYIEDGFNEKQKRSMIKKGDFLINIVGASIGRAAQFDLDCKANMNQASALVRVNDKRIRDKYLLIYLNSEKAQQMYDSMKSDTGRANLSLQDINELTILLPSIERQIEYEEFVKQVDKSKSVVQKSLVEAQLLFDSLMQKHFG